MSQWAQIGAPQPKKFVGWLLSQWALIGATQPKKFFGWLMSQWALMRVPNSKKREYQFESELWFNQPQLSHIKKLQKVPPPKK